MVLISLSLLLMIVVDAELIDDGIWRRLRCGC
jgi:hypothetical protein